jgi:hypothetical protein
MRHSGRWLAYRGELYHFEAFGTAVGGQAPLWAVIRSGEIVGTMLVRDREAERDFVARAMRWLDEVMGTGDRSALDTRAGD